MQRRFSEETGKCFLGRTLKASAKQWWFLLLFLLPQLIPPYTSRGYALREWGMVNAFILTHPIKGVSASFYPIFQILPLVLVAAVLLAGRRWMRVFSAYVALSYTAVAFLQSISVSRTYGLAICTANVVTFLVLAVLWFHEAFFSKVQPEPQKIPLWKYWAVLLALFAFWEPANPQTLSPEFNPIYLFTSGSGLSFCMSTPLYLATLSLFYPRVNRTVFAATGLIGLMMGLGNILLEFWIYPAYQWIGVLHIPLLVLSLYSLGLLSWKTGKAQLRAAGPQE